MSSRAITILGYIAALTALVVLQLLSSLPESRIPSFAVVVRRLARTKSGRVGLLTAWAWLGMHFFAR
ncbi:MAG: hypothetical protein GX536_06515 [Actinobacteria bacterium]|nr:hypothetical protein [Actinomycetota bacterium]OPZ77398.1 MAG: hypothetical protein BWY79_01183 [Actinobacteria bacterium ADurb.Bin444]